MNLFSRSKARSKAPSEERLAQISSQIRDLATEQRTLNEKLAAEQEADVRSCNWLKDVTLIYQEGANAYGGTEYKFLFGYKGDGLKYSTFGMFTLYGNSKDYMNNIMLQREQYGYVLRTSNVDTLCEFLEKFKPKVSKCDFFNKKLSVLMKIRELMHD